MRKTKVLQCTEKDQNPVEKWERTKSCSELRKNKILQRIEKETEMIEINEIISKLEKFFFQQSFSLLNEMSLKTFDFHIQTNANLNIY